MNDVTMWMRNRIGAIDHALANGDFRAAVYNVRELERLLAQLKGQVYFDAETIRREWPRDELPGDKDGARRLAALRKAARPGVTVVGVYGEPDLDIEVLVEVEGGRREVHLFSGLGRWLGVRLPLNGDDE